MATVSDEMRALMEAQRRLHESVLRVQRQIEEEEAAYLEDTVHGNIVRGWDGFIDSKPNRKEALNPKKTKPYAEAEHLFSACCSYAELAKEPTFDLVNYAGAREEPSGRRRLTVTLAGGAKISSEIPAGSMTHGAHGSNSGGKLASMKTGGVRSHHLQGKDSKLLKKRKREHQHMVASHLLNKGSGGNFSDASTAASGEEDDVAGTASSSSAPGTPVRARADSVESVVGGDDIMDVL